MTDTPKPAMFYWVKTSEMRGQFGPYPKEIAEKKRDKWRDEHPGKACSIELAWEAPFEKMLPVKIHENRFGAGSDNLGFIYKVDAKWIYVYVNTRVGKKYHRAGRDAGHEVYSSFHGDHSHSICKDELDRIEGILNGQPFESGLKINMPD
jgi:hypothetical protein